MSCLTELKCSIYTDGELPEAEALEVSGISPLVERAATWSMSCVSSETY